MRTYCLALVLSLAGTGAAAPSLPTYFPLPKGAEFDPNSLVDESYGEADIPNGVADHNIMRGHHWSVRLGFPDIDPEKAADSGQAAAWARLKGSLTAAGWTQFKYFEQNPPSATLQFKKPPIDAWLSVQVFASNQLQVEVVEVKPFTPTFTLTPPAAKVETVGENESFPYLKPIANGKLDATDPDNGALWIQLKGQDEKTLVSPSSVLKRYGEIEGLSNLQFVLEYRSAFTNAGWEIIHESQGINQGDAAIEAHYSKNGRDIWTSLHFGGTELGVTVADRSTDLIAALNKDCRVPMYGITFDFNKSTLRPEAESTLQGVLAALQRDTAIGIEVQGHTDNVGGDAPNLTLSQARADAVKTWLISHAVAAARLTAKGYGRTQPVADNDSDEGRAKNRRVALKKVGCS